MIQLSKDKVLHFHQLIAEGTGSSIGVRDEGLLESALEAAFSTFGGQELYPTKEEKGARIGFNLISNHAFVDGNKRIGMHVMLIFLLVNGIRLNCSNEDVVEAGLGVASGTMDYEQLLQWIIRHKEIKTISTYEKGRRIDLIGRFLRPLRFNCVCFMGQLFPGDVYYSTALPVENAAFASSSVILLAPPAMYGWRVWIGSFCQLHTGQISYSSTDALPQHGHLFSIELISSIHLLIFMFQNVEKVSAWFRPIITLPVSSRFDFDFSKLQPNGLFALTTKIDPTGIPSHRQHSVSWQFHPQTFCQDFWFS